MTGREAILLLREMTKRQHTVTWGLTGGGHGEPGGSWYVANHCERLECGLTEVTGENPDKPCTCGADTLNARVEEALNTLQTIIEKFHRASEVDCECWQRSECEHCDIVMEAREMLDGLVFLNPDGN